MYNGIGLQTARGSGTSGHVTKNLSFVKPEFFRRSVKSSRGSFDEISDRKQHTANAEIIEHNRKRALEAKVFEFQEGLSDNGGLTEVEIAGRVEEYRARLVSSQLPRPEEEAVSDRRNDSSSDRRNFATDNRRRGGGSWRTDTHEVAARNEQQNARAKAAFGLADSYEPGSSFDPEAQARRREERGQQFEADKARRHEEFLGRQRVREQREEERSRNRAERDRSRNRDLSRGRGGSRNNSPERRRGPSRSRDRQAPPRSAVAARCAAAAAGAAKASATGSVRGEAEAPATTTTSGVTVKAERSSRSGSYSSSSGSSRSRSYSSSSGSSRSRSYSSSSRSRSRSSRSRSRSGSMRKQARR